MKQLKTYSPKPGDVSRDWWVVDATDLTLGRLASEVAKLLRGKHKPQFSPHADVGDFVIVINAAQVAVTGRKEEQKMYHRHSNYPGGLRSESLGALRARKPERIIELAVKGMLPKNRLGRKLFGKLKVYAGTEHPHQAQQPKTLDIDVKKVSR